MTFGMDAGSSVAYGAKRNTPRVDDNTSVPPSAITRPPIFVQCRDVDRNMS